MRGQAQAILCGALFPVRAFLAPSMFLGHHRGNERGTRWPRVPSPRRHLLPERSAGKCTGLLLSSEPVSAASACQDEDGSNPAENGKDTIRVRIWRALASGEELSVTQLCKKVGERRGDVRSHLQHVERQAKTIGNKSNDWRVRRGLPPLPERDDGGISGAGAKKMRLKKRRGPKNEVFLRLL